MGRLDVALGTVPELPVTVVFVDLEGFKAINDRHGHVVGDRVLVEAARRIRSTAPSADTVARLGGDEFVIVFRKAAPREVATMIRVLGQPIPLIGGDSATLVASVGVAARRPGEGAEDLIARADHAMCVDKRDRRQTLARLPGALPSSLRKLISR
jgi:cyclic di-GMP phosphodiesterase Gmr